jgi:hypothetical protein
MDKHGLSLVLECVYGLGTLAEFNCMLGHGSVAASVIAGQLENFYGVGLWYGKRKIVIAVTKAFEDARRECYMKNRVDFRPGLTSMRRSVRKVRKELIIAQPTWRDQLRQLDQLSALLPRSRTKSA